MPTDPLAKLPPHGWFPRSGALRTAAQRPFERARSRAAQRQAGDGGFTLLEILVAFVIVALVLGASYQSFSTGSDAILRTQDRLAALGIAESVMQRVGTEIALEPGRQRIDLRPWQAEIEITRFQPQDQGTWHRLGQEPLRVTILIADDSDRVAARIETIRVRPL